MCGPSDSEEELAGQQANFSQTLQANYGQQFAHQADVLSKLNSTLTPIVAAGPSQTGFSPQELAARNTQAINANGAAYSNAAKALGGQLAGRGGDSGLQSGVDQQIKASLASDAARSLSNDQLNITDENYATGRDNYNHAVGGYNLLAGQYNPIGYAGAGSEANSQAFGQATQINKENQALSKDIAGAGVAALSGVLSGGMSFLGGGGSSGAGDLSVGNFGPGFGSGRNLSSLTNYS